MRKWLDIVLTAGLAGTALAAEGAHGEETNIFNADIGNFIFTLIIFGLVIWILGRAAWRPVLNVLHERERTIREALESAQHEREQAGRLLAEYQRQLERAQQEATATVEEGRRDAEAVRQRILEDARRETGEMTQRARREIQLAKDTALKEIYDRAAELSAETAARVLRRTLTTDEHHRLVQESLAEIRGAGGPPA